MRGLGRNANVGIGRNGDAVQGCRTFRQEVIRLAVPASRAPSVDVNYVVLTPLRPLAPKFCRIAVPRENGFESQYHCPGPSETS